MPKPSANAALGDLKSKEPSKAKGDYKPVGHTRFTMNMREDLHEDLRTYCFVNKENMSSVIEELIETHLKKVKIKVVK